MLRIVSRHERNHDRARRGLLIGRYVVISKLGAGAMGVVFAAFDPELDRKVALKLLKHQGGDLGRARMRLQREAQSLAKLDHPNVVSVFDVGVHQQHVFVAMEFVEGRTLGEWMAAVESPRPWPEVLEVFMAAGRGLAAAHETGMVHCDFKPDNVMLGDDGRVRVMDFGLARGETEGEASDESVQDSLLEMRQAVGKLTQTGAMGGTPAYMSFEQFGGQIDLAAGWPPKVVLRDALESSEMIHVQPPQTAPLEAVCGGIPESFQPAREP